MEWALVIAAGVLGGTVAGAVISAWFLRNRTSDPDVDELVTRVAALAKAVRTIQMQRVRAGQGAPAFIGATSIPIPSSISKDELRRRVFGVRGNTETLGTSGTAIASGPGGGVDGDADAPDVSIHPAASAAHGRKRG